MNNGLKTWQLLKQNPQLWPQYLLKQQVIKSIRAFFEAQNYNELESPILAPALPSERYLNFLSTNLGAKTAYLIPSTERFNKIALAAGIGEHFVISKVFRGAEQNSPNHSPEFTMLEWYHLNATYLDLMKDAESLIKHIIQNCQLNLKHEYQGKVINFDSTWERFSVKQLFNMSLNIDLDSYLTLEPLKELIINKNLLPGHGYDTPPGTSKLLSGGQTGTMTSNNSFSWQDCFDLLWFNYVDPILQSYSTPVFVYDYPKILGPLVMPSTNPNYVQKVELYIAGKEVANGYTELTDADLLAANLTTEYEARKQLGLPLAPYDQELINAVASGLPAVAGIGMGLDRLVMILANVKSIAEINIFSGQDL